MANKNKSFSTAGERDGQVSAPEDPTPGVGAPPSLVGVPGVRLDSLPWDDTGALFDECVDAQLEVIPGSSLPKGTSSSPMVSPSIFFGYGSTGEFRPYGRENEHGYWSLLVPSVPYELASPWQVPCEEGRGSSFDVLSVGNFPSEEAAIQWARDHLEGNPYLVRFYSLA